MKRAYLSCEADHISIRYGDPTTTPRDQQEVVQVRTQEELKQFAETHTVDVWLCSSSMDFPEEETQNQTLIDLCNLIRSE